MDQGQHKVPHLGLIHYMSVQDSLPWELLQTISSRLVLSTFELTVMCAPLLSFVARRIINQDRRQKNVKSFHPRMDYGLIRD